MQLSNQALGAIMMALQESLLNQLDIVPILKGWEIEQTPAGLVVKNPPTVRMTTQNNDSNLEDPDPPDSEFPCPGYGPEDSLK